MLRQLRIANIILIESLTITFEKGLNIISGETGAGKSSLMQAVGLALGDRADSSIIRKGAEKASVEVAFEIGNHKALLTLLEESEIDYDPGEWLIIRRELTSSGKNRSYINNQLTQLTLIEKVALYLVDLVGQHSHQKLLSLDFQLESLDLYANLQLEAEEVRKGWINEQALKKGLQEAQASESSRIREIASSEIELQELMEASLKPGEEEELFTEYSILSHAEEISAKASEISGTLCSGRTPILPLLSKQKLNLERLVQMDPSLDELLEAFNGAFLELEEINYSLERRLEKVNYNPNRISTINERLTLINKLKRKYGNSIEEIEEYRSRLEIRLKQLSDKDGDVEQLREELQKLEKTNQQLSENLSQKRTSAAISLGEQITAEIASLNMPRAIFTVQCNKQARGPNGIDRIEYLFSPNLGEPTISLKDCASGGELSRILLALKTILAGKGLVPTLIFDEVDANIGGETAAIVGDKLSQISKRHQTLCITHLPQVACLADHHLQILKLEKEGRTLTTVLALDKATRLQEISRMLGGESFNSATKQLAKKILHDSASTP